ncbi:MAG: phosphoserine phosphatase [Ruminococcaceae bacterium]|nr:phosphoserine phosphatase [Oscillospiraceae bacterium]
MNVYDFDNTIYKGESVLHFFFYYVKKTPYLLKYIPRVFYALIKYKAGKITVEQALENYAPMVEEYFRSIPDIRADAVDFWDKHIHNIKPFYEDIRKDDDVIVTGSPEITIQEVCNRLGIKHCVGSIIDEESGKIKRLCIRSRKVPAFLEAFPDAEIENFYTDSPKNDAPLIELSKHAYHVKGNKIIKIK